MPGIVDKHAIDFRVVPTQVQIQKNILEIASLDYYYRF